MLRRFHMLLVGGVLLLSASGTEAETRVALVIGNSAYKSVPSLRNPVNDARAMDEALSAVGFRVARLENATKAQIEAGLNELSRQLSPQAISLIYYAGHGIQMNGHNYLLPVDVKIGTAMTVPVEGVNVDDLMKQVMQTRARMNIIILDACRDNPFVPANGPSTSLFRDISGGLALIDAPADTLIAFSTAPGKVAADGSGENGLYTLELVRAINTPRASIETVFKKTRIAVVAKSAGTQIPWESSSLTADFSFHP
jgi:uncharacterized caspase-like protein